MLVNNIAKQNINFINQKLDICYNKIDSIFKNSSMPSQVELSLKLLLQKFKAITTEDLKPHLLTLFATTFKEYDSTKGHIVEYKFMSVK